MQIQIRFLAVHAEIRAQYEAGRGRLNIVLNVARLFPETKAHRLQYGSESRVHAVLTSIDPLPIAQKIPQVAPGLEIGKAHGKKFQLLTVCQDNFAPGLRGSVEIGRDDHEKNFGCTDS